jgi:N-acetylneuraminic acid mutarotase
MNRNTRTFSRPAALACAVALLSFVPGQAQSSRQVLHNHVRLAITSGQAAMVGSLPTAQQLRVSMVLPLRNQADLAALLSRLYDPSDPDYRHFLSVEQFTERFGPTAEDYEAVVGFVRANGLTVTDRPSNRMVVPLRGTVAQIEKAFHVSMRVYQHPTENRTFFSPDREPSLNLRVPVAHIAGLNNFSIPRPMVKRAPAGSTIATVTGSGPTGSGPDGYYLGSDMRAAYYGGTALTGAGQAVGLFELDGYDINDVNFTFSSAGQSYNVPVNNVLLDGATGANLFGDDSEEVLDIVQTIGMAPGLSQVRVYIGMQFNDTDVFNAMASENICKQLSVSWGWSYEDNYWDTPIFQEFAAQGQSVFVGSGDYGAFDAQVSPAFYPAEDAWVTAVGGTSLITNGAGGSWASETAWTNTFIQIGSGGGVSPDVIAIPDYQAGVANASNGGSTTLRNVPDVAAEADLDTYVCGNGTCGATGGTSFATPRWAGFMALVNQQAAEAGRPPIGFLNPAIYSIGQSTSYSAGFHDIISGNNDCCGQPVWYSAVAGYDLVTGWGSPNGQNLIDALTPPPTGPGFILSDSPGSFTINPGGSGSSTVVVTPFNGFTGSVALTATGLPSGVTASFGTNPTTGSSVLTLTAGIAAALGTATVIVTGSCAGFPSATTTVTLTVYPLPGFTLTASPGSLTIARGASGTSTVTVTDQGGFSGVVSLSASGLPSGVTASFNPNPTIGGGALTLTAGATAALGTTTVTITGNSAGFPSGTTTLALTVNAPPPGFALVASPGGLAIAQGASGTSAVTVTDQGGFSGVVSLSASGLPSGVTASFNPNPTTGRSVLTLTASGNAVLGTATVTITGSNGGVPSATVTLALMVTGRVSAANQWTWMGGGSTAASYAGNPGVYGTLGVPAAENIPGGRSDASSWTDSSGHLWLFGGAGADANGNQGFLNDLWEFDPSTNEWAWIGGASTAPVASWNHAGNPGGYGTLGVPAAGNIPGGRVDASSWTDRSGRLWLFGGSGYDASGNLGLLNDLWEFTPSTNQWAWMGGSSTVPVNPLGWGAQPGVYGTLGVPAAGNIPGGRAVAASWTDSSGHLWLFGGTGYDASTGDQVSINDLWEFNPSANEWAWMGGSGTVTTGFGNTGVYGTFGVPAAGNIPGSRQCAASWIDRSGHLWLFGGEGYDAAEPVNDLNDLWEFNPSANEWAWMGGTSTVPAGSLGSSGVYGTLGVPAVGNIPGGRQSAPYWTDSNGYFWLFGGSGIDANGNDSNLTDLWEFDPATSEWAWMGGSGTATNTATYGTLGVPAKGNIPGNRVFASTWTDDGGRLWLFGGNGYDGNGNQGHLNDLWEYLPSAPRTAGFKLSANPGNLTIAQGASGASAIKVTDAAGFTGRVTLSAGGLPSGVTASFAPNPTTGTSVLSLAANSSVAPGSYPITITGTSGSLIATTTVSLTVTAAVACHVGYTITTQWPGGFQADITIGNTGARALTGWTLTWTFANGQSITQLWDGNVKQSGANVTVTNMSYNGNIPAGTTYVGVGFNGTWNNKTNQMPTSFAVNGTACK